MRDATERQHRSATRAGRTGAATAATIVCTSALVCGCVTYPHPRDVVLVSPVSGVVRTGEAAVADLELTIGSVFERTPCAEPLARTRTDQDGRFAFAEVTRRAFWRTVILAPSSPTWYVDLCRQTPAGLVPLYAEAFWAALPRQLELDCDLESGAADCDARVTGFDGRRSFLSDVEVETSGDRTGPPL